MTNYTVNQLVFHCRYFIAAFVALCTQDFFRLGVLAWLEGVYRTISTFLWVIAIIFKTLILVQLENLTSMLTMGITGYIVIRLISRLTTDNQYNQ